MPIVAARESYFETGLEVLADSGFGGLKLAKVCSRLGVTTGSFYHYFSGWGAFTRELIAYWREDRTVRVIEVLRAQSDIRKRIQAIIAVGLWLPHSAESAIRAWSSIDEDVAAVQREVDQQRFELIYESALEIVGLPDQAKAFAAWAMFVFVGYEQVTLPRDPATFEWICNTMIDDLEAGRFAGAPTF